MGQGSTTIDRLEETFIAVLLGLMTAITFANVVARYVFNSNILWALEITVFMFAWLVLLGAGYAVKKGLHLGVDVIVNVLEPARRRRMALVAAALCIIYAALLMKGSWDYWANFANLPATEGRWFPLGFEENYRANGWYEVNDIPLPEVLRWMEAVFNEGEEYEKVPRFLPYMILPISAALLLYRFIQAGLSIWRWDADRLVASHEVEDDIDEARARVEEAD